MMRLARVDKALARPSKPASRSTSPKNWTRNWKTNWNSSSKMISMAGHRVGRVGSGATAEPRWAGRSEVRMRDRRLPKLPAGRAGGEAVLGGVEGDDHRRVDGDS